MGLVEEVLWRRPRSTECEAGFDFCLGFFAFLTLKPSILSASSMSTSIIILVPAFKVSL